LVCQKNTDSHPRQAGVGKFVNGQVSGLGFVTPSAVEAAPNPTVSGFVIGTHSPFLSPQVSGRPMVRGERSGDTLIIPPTAQARDVFVYLPTGGAVPLG